MMDAELKAKWVAALRSGEFEQTKMRLFDGRGYCCLGVLAAICGANLLEEKSRDLMSSYHPSFMQRVGDVVWPGELADMNDQGNTFPEIADYIEANL